jgi:hypothetical protein
MRRRAPVQQAFDEARFGATRTLNVREPMLSALEAVRRVEGWLRAKQVEQVDEVLVITGRGNGSPGQVGVVREEVLTLLRRLGRAGVVAGVQDHTPGSFVVRLAPLRALFEAPPRTRDGHVGRQRYPRPRNPASLAGLAPDTLEELRRLSTIALQALGIASPDEDFIQGEMERNFAMLTRAGGGALTEDGLRAALAKALLEYEDEEG